jgi:tyrosyl-tRNA synthetase
VTHLLKTLCLESLADLEHNFLSQHALAPEKRVAHKKLAESVVKLIHGQAGLDSALRTTNALFSNSASALGLLSKHELMSGMKGACQTPLLLEPGLTVMQMALKAKCFADEVNARRVIQEGGFYVNHRKIMFPDAVLIPGEHILPNGTTLARVGKKNHVLIEWLA